MTVLNSNTSVVCRHPVMTTLLYGAIGFLCGFLLSLLLSAYSLYTSVEIL
jgi:hypothetical protein